MNDFKKLNSDFIECDGFVNFHLHIGGSLFEKAFNKKINLLEFIAFSDYWNNKLKKLSCDRLAWNLAADYSVKTSKYYGTTQICTMLGDDILDDNVMKYSYVGYPFMNSDKLKVYLNDVRNQYFNYRRMLIDKWLNAGIFFHSLYANSEFSLKIASELLNKYKDDFFQIHCAEDDDTVAKTFSKFHKSPIQVLKEYNLINKNTTIVHGCKLSDDDLKIIKDNGATIIICPASNLRVGQIPLDPLRLNKLGVKWIIASDGLGTCESLNLRYQAKILKECYPKVRYLDLWRAITTNPSNKVTLEKIYFKIDGADSLDDEQIAEYLIENYNCKIYNKEGSLIYKHKPKRKFNKFIPLKKDLKKFRREKNDKICIF